MIFSRLSKNPFLVIISIFVLIVLFSFLSLVLLRNRFFNLFVGKIPKNVSENIKIEKFASVEDFKKYISEARETQSYSFRGFGMANLEIAEPALDSGMPLIKEAPERVSETNVQVKGIDEPDIVKTNGRSIFFSQNLPFYTAPIFLEQSDSRFMPQINASETKIIKGFPPSDLVKDSAIAKSGNLLLANNSLIIFSEADNFIYGYDVSDPKNPREKWKFEIDNRNYLVSSRLTNNKIYVIVSQSLNEASPCPLPFSSDAKGVIIPCTDIYHPINPVPVDQTYTIFSLNPSNGKLENKISFVGSSGQSVFYMSKNFIYITYPYNENLSSLYYNFFKDKASDLIPEETLISLKNLETYKISENAKMVEVQIILEKLFNSLSGDERKRVENEINNRSNDYLKDYVRDYQKSGIVKISNAHLDIDRVGSIPGTPLNQFSLDEYQSSLRIAVTISSNLFGFSQTESANDVYVLDKNLGITGEVLDLGLSERIYSVRFIEDKGYVVTFKQVDPFYVIDLANPNNPEKVGELKIPGFSSYLHPITKDKILGVGREDANVKLSLFDVGNPKNPKEVSKYSLDEYWTDVSTTHHAFLLDDKHEIFFLPAGTSGYIFGYQGNELKLLKVVSDVSAQRALFINDYLYVIGNTKISVLDENTWNEVNSLTF